MSFDFNLMIHEERTNCLRSLPAFSGTVLSAGCAGAWYFDWFRDCTGHTGRHIGLELFSPKPDGLAANVDWIANSVEKMESVTSASVDLIFSGQNVEHLSAQSMGGFLLEASRVLKPDGLIVLDSPNRSLTEHLGYMQPEHSLEFTVDEMTSMLEVAGFDVQETRGIWLLVDPKKRTRLHFGGSLPGEMSNAQRQVSARDHPQDSFIWWVAGRRRRDAQPDAVRAFVNEIYWRYYKGFVSARYNNVVGRKDWHWGSTLVTLSESDNGYALFGPYIPLAPGSYVAGFVLKPHTTNNSRDAVITLDVVSAAGTVTHARRVVAGSALADPVWQRLDIPFTLDQYTTGVEIRCHANRFGGQLRGDVDILPA